MPQLPFKEGQAPEAGELTAALGITAHNSLTRIGCTGPNVAEQCAIERRNSNCRVGDLTSLTGLAALLLPLSRRIVSDTGLAFLLLPCAAMCEWL